MPLRPLLGLCFLLFTTVVSRGEPFRLAIVGLDHGHVDSYLAETLKRADVKLVGVVEPKAALAASFAERFHLPAALQFSSLEAMLAAAKP